MTTHKKSDIALHCNQVRLEPKVTINCGIASLAAYRDYERKSSQLPPSGSLPSGFKCIDRFTGWDKILNLVGYEERFGLILQSIAKPTTYLIAFRGTDSAADAYEDIWADTVAFKPYNQATFPKNVHVADGFNSIYTSKGEGMSLSMQEQLFEKLSNQTPPPEKIIITGHSLGGPLASLFALDIAHSFGSNVKVTNITFASPRVGLQTWKDTYNKKYALEAVTYRIANYQDGIPSLPPELLSYHHIGQPFLVNFYVKDFCTPHYVDRHSLINYFTVIKKAVELNPQVYVGEFQGKPPLHRLMESAVPPSLKVPELGDVLHDLEQQTLTS